MLFEKCAPLCCNCALQGGRLALGCIWLYLCIISVDVGRAISRRGNKRLYVAASSWAARVARRREVVASNVKEAAGIGITWLEDISQKRGRKRVVSSWESGAIKAARKRSEISISRRNGLPRHLKKCRKRVSSCRLYAAGFPDIENALSSKRPSLLRRNGFAAAI